MSETIIAALAGFGEYLSSEQLQIIVCSSSVMITNNPHQWCSLTAGHEYQYLTNSTQQGRLSKEELSVSVVRIMKTFIMLGELDPPDMVPYSK